MRLTTEQFIEKAKQVHGDKYDYSLIDYKNCRTKVKIVCPIHGVFEQTPITHLRSGCPECGKETMKQKLSSKEKKEKVNFEILTPSEEIKNRNTIIKIKCPECNKVFEKSYWNFLRTKLCPLCDPNKAHQRKTTEQFIEEAKKVHGDNYDYSSVNYVNNKTKIEIKCNKCGLIFKQIPKEHLDGAGCSNCNGGTKYSIERFIEKSKQVHGDKYDYSLVDYKNTYQKVKIKCLECGDIFEISPNSFLQGRGCLHGEKSLGEKIIKEYLVKNNIKFEREFIFEELKGLKGGDLRVDFYLPELNTVIEFQGMQHYRPRDIWGGKEYLEILNKHDQLKRDYCKRNNIKEIEISYKQIRNINKILNKQIFDEAF